MRKLYLILLSFILLMPSFCFAMPPGALVYRTSSEGRMYGYSDDPLIYEEEGILKNVYSGHVGIYIGQEDGIDYIVEALANGIVKTPADKFVNLAEGEKYLGAKIPNNLSAIQQAKVVAIAKSLVGKNLNYDFDFKVQKGPDSGEWTCVGLTEKLYESANISNPNNLNALEYDENYYALNITPDGFNNYSVVNSQGDCFSSDYEFSKIASRPELIIPASELVGFDVGLIKDDERYIFLPYTQFLQPSLSDVMTDITVESYFSGSEVRGSVPTKSLILRWSLINNPISSLSIIARQTKEAVISIADKIFGNRSGESDLKLTGNEEKKVAAASGEKEKQASVVINKSAGNKIFEEQPKKTASSGKDSTKKTKNADSGSANTAINKANGQTNNTDKNQAQGALTNKTNSAAKNISQEEKIETAKIASYYNPVKENDAAVIESPKLATINKIYSTGNNKWIELYNPTDQDFDLAAAGYRLEKAKTAADPSLIMRIGNSADGSYPGGTVIKAHDSYLIVKSTANNFYLNQADAVATRDAFTWPESGYTLYLGIGAISSNSDEDIVEAVGFGNDATYFQGSGPAPEIMENYSLNRQKSTGNNNLDFKLIKSNDPAIDWDTEETEIDNSDPAETELDINSNTSSSTNPIATSTDTAISSTTEVLKLPISLNGLYGTSINDWIELFNPNDYDIDLFSEEYRLEKTKTALDPVLMMRIGDPLDGVYPRGTIIKAKSSYLIVRDDANDYFRSKADAIATRLDFNLANSGHTIYLANGPVSSSTDENIVDMVGIGADSIYWRGGSPSEAMINNYELNRIAYTGDNHIDYKLAMSDDPNIDWQTYSEDVSSSTDIYSFNDSDYDLYVPPEPIDSSGLEYLWHFDECSGLSAQASAGETTLATKDNWTAGKFGCAKAAGFLNGNIIAGFEKSIDVNNFSMSFWFRATMDNPRLTFTLANPDGDYLSATLEPNLLEFTGLPNPDWRYYQPFAFNDIWRQATLVVNRENGYWALYVDGEEIIRIESYKKLAPMSILEINGNNGPFAIDELAIWSRALSPNEVHDFRNLEAPFSPITQQEPQLRPKLIHFWDFNEGIGTTSHDLVSNANLVVNKNSWSNFAVDNSGITIGGNQGISTKFSAIESRDISLSLKWRSLDTTVGNRARFALSNKNKSNIFTFIPTEYSSGYYFNGYYSYYDFSSEPSIPLDSDWHYLALVYDSYRNELNYYVDGELKGQHSRIWPSTQPFADSLEMIAENGNVEIDDLGIWEGALSQGQIQSIFANN